VAEEMLLNNDKKAAITNLFSTFSAGFEYSLFLLKQ